MNILAKEELVNNLDSKEVNKFFKEKEYLESISSFNYLELKQNDKTNVDILLNDIDFTITTLLMLIQKNDYLKWYVKKVLYKFLTLETKREVANYLEMLYDYVNKIDYIVKALDNKDELSIKEIKNIYVLTFLLFITYTNDIKKMDYYALNLKKYKDSDFVDYTEVKKVANAYSISIASSNRKYTKKEN